MTDIIAMAVVLVCGMVTIWLSLLILTAGDVLPIDVAGWAGVVAGVVLILLAIRMWRGR